MNPLHLPPHKAAFAQLRAFALSFPEATEDFPWGESAFKVRRKVFAFTRNDEGITSVKVV